MVLSDRSSNSSLAYQGGAGDLGSRPCGVNAFGMSSGSPIRTLVLALAEGGARAAHRDNEESDRIGGSPEGYHQKVDSPYRQIAAEEPQRVRIVDASGEPTRLPTPIEAIADLLRDRGSGPRGWAVSHQRGKAVAASWLAPCRPKGVGKASFRAGSGDAVLAEAAGTAGAAPGLDISGRSHIAKLVEAAATPIFAGLSVWSTRKTIISPGNYRRPGSVPERLFDLNPSIVAPGASL